MFAKLTPSLLVMSLLVLLPGCSKRKEATSPPVSATPPAQVEAQQSAPAPASVPPTPVKSAGQAQVSPVSSPPAPIPAPVNGNFSGTLSELSYQLRIYVAQTRKAPKTFPEFVAASGVSAPQPPNGMHYAIRSGQVVLEH